MMQKLSIGGNFSDHKLHMMPYPIYKDLLKIFGEGIHLNKKIIMLN